MKRLLNRMAMLLAAILALSGMSGFALAEAAEDDAFSLWNPEAPALSALIDYVEAVTDEASPDYIPPVDRIATFDMDGTLMGELFPTYLEVMLLTTRILADPSYTPDAEMLEFGRMTRDHALDKSFPADYDYEFSYHQARAFAGMTLDEYADFITRFLVHEADGFEGMTYADAYYLPMAEVVEYLQDNGFKCYVVSGSDRFIVRTFIEGIADIPYECIIGSDTALEARNQGDVDGIEYVFTGDDELVRTDRLLVKDLKTNKVLQIAQEIGRQPVLSFGNSSGDVSMNNYALLNNRYRSAAFMLVADDDVRDYGNPEKGAELTEKWRGMGYNVISMRDDWRTIYGEDVKKTGEFHWLEDYAEDIVPAADAQEETGETGDVQYVVYLGTNDKDTDKPVFTQAEAMEKAREILIRRFGGYTIQEAHGGWIGDDGTEYQEYTLVIYLSGTTLDAVHAAADELVETFRQSSVLIQANPTTTEFYGGAESADAGADAAAEQTDTTVSDIQKYGNLVLSVSGSELLARGFAYGDIVNVAINGQVYEMPVGSSFSDVEQGSMICRVVIKEDAGEDYVLLAINMGDMATAAGIAGKEAIEADPGYAWHYNEGVEVPVGVSIAMKEQGGYYDQWVIHQLARSENREDYPALTDAEFANFRAVEVGDIAAGRLYRSSSPVNPQINRSAYADAAAEAAGVRTIVNLADNEETMQNYEGFDGSYYSGQDVVALNLGVDFGADDFRTGLAEGLRFIADREGPYLVHCNEGKERAGFVSAILECLMGASEGEVVADYMTTFYNYYGVEPGTEQYEIIADSNIRKSLCTAFGLDSLEGIDLRACAEAYLQGIGLSQDEIDGIRANLSE